MLKLLTTFFLVLLTSLAVAQADSSNRTQSPDTTRRTIRQGFIGRFIVAEALLIGTSYYASKPGAYGDKVVGWLYAGSSAALLLYMPFYWTSKSNHLNQNFKKDRIWNAVTMVGLSYGFSRIATYNLLNSDGDTFRTRFKRNIIESHAAYFSPILSGLLTQKLLIKNKPHNKVQTNLLFDGSGLYLTVRFK